MKLAKSMTAAIACLLATSVHADHAAIVYCGLDAAGQSRVLAADAPVVSTILTSVKRGAPCAQTLHEFMANGYELTSSFPASPPGLIPVPLQIEGLIIPDSTRRSGSSTKRGYEVELEADRGSSDRARRSSEEALARAIAVTVFVLVKEDH